jgi:ABC-2 type transport system ATP-binding protein
MLAGIIRPTGGEAVVAGHRIDRDVERLHEVIGMLTETPGLYGRLSARRNLEYFAGFYPIDDVSARVEKYLKLMGLWERREDKAGTFSKGMKQRLALARALMHEPKVLFLDEPTSGLDPEAASEVRQLIRKMREEGCTIFLSTHNLGEAEMLCNRIAVIQTRLLALDTAESLRRRFFRRRVVVELQSPDPNILAVVRGLPFVQEAQEDGSRLSGELVDSERNRPELVRAIVEAGGNVVAVSEEQYTLEQVYLKLMNEEKVSEAQAHS